MDAQMIGGVAVLDGNATLSQVAARYLLGQSGKTIRTIRGERRNIDVLKEFFGADRRLADITPERADAYKLWLAARYKANTVRNKLVQGKMICEYAVSIKILAGNPFSGVTLPAAEFTGQVLEDSVLRKLLHALSQRARRVALFMLYTGMRPREIMAMDWSWIKGRAIVIPRDATKNRRGRTFMLHRSALRALGRRGVGRVWGFSQRTLEKETNRVIRSLNLGHFRFYDLRHTWATRYWDQKKPDPYAMCNQGGWRSLNSTMPYQHMTRARQGGGLDVRYRI